MTKKPTAAIIDQAIDCQGWPSWLHEIVESVMAAVDEGCDLSTEQAIGMGILMAQAQTTKTEKGPDAPVDEDVLSNAQLAAHSHDAAMIFATQDQWEHGDQLRIRGMLVSMQSVMAAVLASPNDVAGSAMGLEAELEGLTEQLISDGHLERHGDTLRGLGSALTAITAFKQLIAAKRLGEKPVSPAEVERALKAFAIAAHDVTPEQYDAERAAPMSPNKGKAFEKSLNAMRRAISAARRPQDVSHQE